MFTVDTTSPPASPTPPPCPARGLWSPPPLPPPCKKPRLSNHPPPQPENTTPPPLASSRPPPHPTSVFYKTRLCRKFLFSGTCPYGDSCTFAHGSDDLRQPMPNWQAIAPLQRSREPGGGNAAGSRWPPPPVGLGFRGQGDVPGHIMACNSQPSGDCRSGEDRVILPRGSAEWKRTPEIVEENLKNPGDDAPRGDLPKSVDDSASVGKNRSVTANKIFQKMARVKKIVGIYGDWLE